MRQLLSFCESQRAWLLDSIERLVRIESPSTDKSAVDRCGSELARQLRELGARIRPIETAAAGDHLLAEVGSGESQVLLLGHFDTVWPVGQLARMPVRRADGRLTGPGTFDMKAGVGIGMLAVRALVETARLGAHRVVMLWTTDEEIGSETSRSLIEEEARRSKAALVLEPALPGGTVKTRRKGCGEFEILVRGIPAHAGIDPGKGASAILELAHQILALEAIQDPDRGVSINVGLVTGGTRTNVIAEEAIARVDVRVAQRGDTANVEAAFRALTPRLRGTALTVTGGVHRPPLERTAGVARLYELAREVARELGQDLAEGGIGGGFDGNFTAALGVPTLDGLGAVGDGAHALHEYVEIEPLPWRAALVAGLIARVVEGGLE
jgi:glutamate carboxypeptidase